MKVKKNHEKGTDSVTVEGVTIQYTDLRKLTALTRALDNGKRQSIIEFLDKKGTANVTEIMMHLKMEEPPVSQHLAILRRAGLVKKSPVGKFRDYYAVKDRFVAVAAAIEAVK